MRADERADHELLAGLKYKRDVIDKAIRQIEASLESVKLALYGEAQSSAGEIGTGDPTDAQCANLRHRGNLGAKY